MTVYKALVERKTGAFVGYVVPSPGDNMLSHKYIDVPDGFDPATHRFDTKTKQVAADPERVKAASIALVDGLHCQIYGDGAIAFAHARKALEAHAVIAFGDKAVAPLLTAEAAATGVDVLHLAKAIVNKDAAFITAEIDRRVTKEALKNG